MRTRLEATSGGVISGRATRTEGSQARDEELAQPEPGAASHTEAEAPSPAAFDDGSRAPTGSMLQTLQASSGNAAVLRLMQRREAVKSDLRLLVDDSLSIGAAFGRGPAGVVQRQPQAPAAEKKEVDPAVKAMWASSVVAPLTKAVELAQGATIQDEANLLRQAHERIESARANVKTTFPQIKDDPALKGRMELLNSSLLRVSNKIVILVSPSSVTFKATATAAQHIARDAAAVEPKLRPATPAEPTATSPKTSTAILRALWKANVSDKLKPLHGKLIKGAQPDAAAALATVKAASDHVWGLVPAYAANDEPMAAIIARVGHRLGDLDNQLSFLAEGKKPDLEALAKDVQGRKEVAEGIF